MLARRVLSLTLGLAAVIALPALAADNPPFKVKPGLWELTDDSERSGTPPIPEEQLQKMTPEQRARLEAAMQQSMGPRHRVQKHCITQAQLNKGFADLEGMNQGNCTRQVTAATPTLRSGTFSCTGRQTMNGSYRFEARTAESVVGTWDMTMGGGDKSMKMKADIKGKWLAADCGDVKPEKE